MAPVKITSENIQMVDSHVTFYQRSYRKFVKPLQCMARKKVFRYSCGTWSHYSIVHNAPIITCDSITNPEQCLKAKKTGKTKITELIDERKVDIKHGVSKVTFHIRRTNLEKILLPRVLIAENKNTSPLNR